MYLCNKERDIYDFVLLIYMIALIFFSLGTKIQKCNLSVKKKHFLDIWFQKELQKVCRKDITI